MCGCVVKIPCRRRRSERLGCGRERRHGHPQKPACRTEFATHVQLAFRLRRPLPSEHLHPHARVSSTSTEKASSWVCAGSRRRSSTVPGRDRGLPAGRGKPAPAGMVSLLAKPWQLLRSVWQAVLPDLARTGIDVELSGYGVNCVGADAELFVSWGAWAEACREARAQRLPLVAYIHSPEHEDTEAFVRGTFTHAGVVAMLQRRCLFWAASVYDNEGRALAAHLDAEAYPLLVVVCVQPGGVENAAVVLKVEGALGADLIHRRLAQAVETCETVLAAGRDSSPASRLSMSSSGVDASGGAASPNAARFHEADAASVPRLETAEERRLIREEQEAALRDAEAADRAAQLRRVQEEERALRVQLEEVARAQQLEQRERDRAAQQARSRDALPAEPPASVPGVTTLKITFGETSIQRRFLRSDSLRVVHDVVTAHPAHDGADFVLCAFPGPRLLDPGASLETLSLYPRAAVFARPASTV
eukprot:TRINITY_DN5567_c1_g7_i1.p1 TRINITY_DN5567_c1_g7~~TRINITY_DN5567_c1_g7_i1.p1  ORF type:complete len:476 (+),score=105.03 TRINITY_DN5567_c1_g7_i1:1090-2517(+)